MYEAQRMDTTDVFIESKIRLFITLLFLFFFLVAD